MPKASYLLITYGRFSQNCPLATNPAERISKKLLQFIFHGIFSAAQKYFAFMQGDYFLDVAFHIFISTHARRYVLLFVSAAQQTFIVKDRQGFISN